jgi:hypothetical protein
MKKNPADIDTSDAPVAFTDPSDYPPVRWNDPLDAPVDPVRLRQLAAQIRPANVLDDQELVAATVRRLLTEDPDVSAAALMEGVEQALVTSWAQRHAHRALDKLAFLAEGGVRTVPWGSTIADMDPPSPALSKKIELMLQRERERRAGRRFGSA